MFDRTAKASLGTILGRGVMAGMLVALTACGTTSQKEAKAADDEASLRDALQIDDLASLLQTAPDEFSVITKRPLEMPQDFSALPTPEPGKPSTRDPDPIADARAALSFQPVPAATGRVGTPVTPSASEAVLLSNVGSVDPNIRSTLAAEKAEYDSEQDLYVLDRLFPSFREARGAVEPEAIDPEAERLRLLEAGIGAQQPTRTATLPVVLAPTPVIAPAPVIEAVPAPSTGVTLPAAPSIGAAELIYLPQ